MEHELDHLPGPVRERILSLGIPCPERFASVPFPALGDRSILDVLEERHGQDEVLSLLGRIEGYLGRVP
jgi:hypothetical protein